MSNNLQYSSMLSKEQVETNRLRIRNNMKVCLVTPKSQLVRAVAYESASPTEARTNGRTNRRRRMTEDLSQFVKTNKIKEIYISQNFADLFAEGEKLGEGAQSVVKKCVELATGKVYAVKRFRSCDGQLIEMLKMQYKLLTGLSHPNIIEGYYLFVNEKSMSCQMILEYCDYPTLTEAMKEAPLTIDEISLVLSKLLSVVNYLHQNGVCHRDIKPDNILFNRSTKDLKLIDFEIAKACRTPQERLEMWTHTGTLAYKAPEMFACGYNELVDVWAVGVVAFQMVTGKLPFFEEYEKDTMNAIKNKEADIPDWLEDDVKEFLHHSLEKNSLKRPSAHQLLHHPFVRPHISETDITSPVAWTNKSCGTSPQRRSSHEDTTEPFSIKCFQVLEEDEVDTCLGD